MKKKIVVLALSLGMVFSMTACGDGASNDSSTEKESTSGSDTAQEENAEVSSVEVEETEQEAEEVDLRYHGEEFELEYPRNFTFSIGGTEYAFPITYDELTERGWTYSYEGVEDATQLDNLVVSAGADLHYTAMPFDNESLGIKGVEFYFQNPNDSGQLALKECEVSGFNVDFESRTNLNGEYLDVEVPDGAISINGSVTNGVTIKPDVYSVLGEDWTGMYSSDRWSYQNDEDMLGGQLEIEFDENGVFKQLRYRKVNYRYGSSN